MPVLRDRRVVLLAAAVVAAAVVVGSVVALSAGGDSSSEGRTTVRTTATGSESRSRRLLAGIPQRGLLLGRPSAPTKLVEFADPQCPYCARWSDRTFPVVVRRFVRTGKVRVELRGLHFLGPDSETALRAVLAAGLQNRAWNMNEELYARQGEENTGWVTEAVLRDAAEAAGVDVAKMNFDRDSARVTAQIRQTDAVANALGVRGTPTFALVRPLGNPQLLQVASLEPADFTAALSAAIGE